MKAGHQHPRAPLPPARVSRYVRRVSWTRYGWEGLLRYEYIRSTCHGYVRARITLPMDASREQIARQVRELRRLVVKLARIRTLGGQVLL